MFVLAACGGGDDNADDPVEGPIDVSTEPTAVPTEVPAESSTPSTPTDSASATEVPAALDFSAPLVGGGEIEMGEFAGRPVLLWFWAPW